MPRQATELLLRTQRRVTLSVWKGRSKITETYITELLRNLEVQIKLRSTLASACIT